MKEKNKIPNPKRMRIVNRPAFRKEDLKPRNIKVRITTYISEDIYLWLKKESENTGTPYQILLNQKLRESYERSQRGSIENRLEFLEKKLRLLKVA